MNMDQSILYVDIENLQEIAQDSLISAVEHWPAGFPKPGTIKLYVKADQTELWRIWGNHNFHSIEVVVNGVQHYTFNGSKNSADLFLALDAFGDITKGRTKYVAVLSDDSDYVSLFAAIKKETVISGNSRLPFLWLMTNRPDTRSQMLTDFFPSEYVHTLSNAEITIPAAGHVRKVSPPKPIFSDQELIARTIIQNIPVGTFKSTDTKKIIVKYFPANVLGKSDFALFGTQFSKVIWPYLEKFGVTSQKPSRGPRKYEITELAKKAVG
jgi:hypothetical protein